MLNLYYKPTCPFSKRVLAEAELLGVTFDLKNIKADEVLRDELIQKGGKKQTPFLEDTDSGTKMYESGDIIDYLNEHSTNGKPKELRVYTSEATCDVCH